MGERGEAVSKFINKMLGAHTFEDVHVCFTPARTKLINDHLEKWINETASGTTKVQVTNLGAGVDTRAFWLEPLSKVERYVEVDVEPL